MAAENTFLPINSLLIVIEAWSMALFVGFHTWLAQWKHLQSSILNSYCGVRHFPKWPPKIHLTINSLLIVIEAWSMALFVGFHTWLAQWKHFQSSIFNSIGGVCHISRWPPKIHFDHKFTSNCHRSIIYGSFCRFSDMTSTAETLSNLSV